MKKFILGNMLLLAACSSSVQPEEPNIQVARKLFETFNRHDWKAMTELYAEEALFLDPSFGKEFVSKSRSETAAKYAGMQSMFPDLHDSVTSLYTSGESVIIEFVSTGTSQAGTKFTLPIVSILTIQNGQIVKDATYYDL